MHISLTIYVIGMKCYVCILKVLLEGRMSQIFDLGPSFHFRAKSISANYYFSEFSMHFYMIYIK